MASDCLQVSEEVRAAQASGRAVVALETTVIAHGLPRPLNLETARACEAAVAGEGAQPATIGIVAGRLTVGLSNAEVEQFGAGRASDGSAIEKVGLNNLAGVMARGSWGATTVAATLRIAALASLRVFATGGIGGVHRGASETFDVSADLTALGRTRLVCVCAGAKAILDLPKTVEVLETLGVPIVGYRTKEFPAFYSRESGLNVDVTVNSPEEAAAVALNHWRTGGESAVLVCAPVPADTALPREQAERAVTRAITMADEQGIRGKALTPFLLAQMKELTEGKTLVANRALLVNNATIATQIAVQLTKVSSIW
ncbi:MAG TPA: pseudouridine-5'-phosphate glycosidase [Blastocatellia bacterium]|nr:pseudouridine-5'-phosphate glycosidase [Blastocatellia bacterium]